jgi:hypothetical protein
MPEFNSKSSGRLGTCDIDIVRLFNEAVKQFDCTVLEGTRGALVQMGYYHSSPRKTKLVYPFSKHNPSKIDIPAVAAILGCAPELETIAVSIVNATPEQLIKIDMLDPLEKSRAVDVVPYPIDWAFEKNIIRYVGVGLGRTKKLDMNVVHNIERWFKFGGKVLGIAQQMGIPLIWGGDWDGDNCMSDQRFDDLPHFQLKD